MAQVSVRTRIAVEITRDTETGYWYFHVDEPRVIGGGCDTLEEARLHAAEAIAFALEADPDEGEREGFEYLPISVG